MARLVVIVVAAGALLLGALAASAKGPPPDRASDRVVIELSGSIDGLYPAARSELPVRIVNPYPFPITVTELDVTVADAGSDCPASVLELATYAGGVQVPRRSQATVPLPISMLAAAPDACQGASFPLTYRATASRTP